MSHGRNTVGMNAERVAALASAGKRHLAFAPGERVQWKGRPGVVAAVYVDLEAAFDSGVVASGVVASDWWENLADPASKRPKADPWYSVILDDGAILSHADNLNPLS